MPIKLDQASTTKIFVKHLGDGEVARTLDLHNARALLHGLQARRQAEIDSGHPALQKNPDTLKLILVLADAISEVEQAQRGGGAGRAQGTSKPPGSR